MIYVVVQVQLNSLNQVTMLHIKAHLHRTASFHKSVNAENIKLQEKLAQKEKKRRVK